MNRFVLACSVTLSLFPTVAFAAVPSQMTVQGKLTNASGNPLPAGIKTFVFRIFDAQSGGTEIWPGGPGETQFISTDADGLWLANVGAVAPLIDAVFAFTPRWLQITVNDGQTLTTLPRTQLVTSPYAQRVATVDGATGGQLFSGLDMPYLTAALNGNNSGIRWRQGTTPQSAFGLTIFDGISFQGSYDGSNDQFGVRAPTIDGSLGPVVFSVGPGGEVAASSLVVTNGGVERMRVTPEGHLGFGGINTAFRITLPNINDDAGRAIANLWLQWSSRRWKTDIRTLDGALDTVTRLRGVRYRSKSGGGEEIGLIAEEVGEVVPEVVSYEENGVDASGLDYARLTALLIEAVKEQQRTIEIQQERIEKLERAIQP